MIYNFLKVAWRNMSRQKFYALVNIAGLAVGIACCLLILLYVRDELSYDTFPERADRIYRVASEINFGGTHAFYAVAPAPMGPALAREFPEVADAFRFRGWGELLVRQEGDIANIKETKVAYADSNFFAFFTVPVLAGDPEAALRAPNSVAISAAAAERYFSSPADAVGKTLIFDDKYAFQVTAVYRNIPRNAHFRFDILMAMSGYEDSRSPIWLSNNYHTYIRLREGANAEALSEKIPDMFKKYAGPQVMQILEKSMEEIETTGQGSWYTLQPLRDIHLRSDYIAEIEANSDIKYVYIFSSIALFILIIACINFMNLATARSAGRAREVGVRKTMGAQRRELTGQFLIESLLLSGIAFSLAIVLARIALPAFNQLIDKTLYMPLSDPGFLIAMIAGALLVGLLAGSYPAFFLSSFRPVETLKGKLRAGMGGGNLRNGLVVFQFVMSIFLIIGALVVNEQLRYIRGKKLGFEREQVLVLNDAYALGDQRQAFKQEIERWPEVFSASYSSYLPVRSSRNNTLMWPEGRLDETNSVSTQVWSVDHDYLPSMGMELALGRNFSRDMPTDSSAVIINEKAARLFGLGDQVIGKRISKYEGHIDSEIKTYTIIGVARDFHFESLRQNIGALVMLLAPSSGYLSIRYQSDRPAALIERLQAQWRAMAPGQPFSHAFLDERFEAIYTAEQRTGQVFLLFAGLAIFVACLGLFALATFTAERRVREIGIRKVLGASVGQIFALLSSEFLRWVALACFIALPLGWYFGRRWLEDFAYASPIKWWIFLFAAFLALVIALCTVSFQAVRAARRNPAESLRWE
jgi:putative ABC transport system permease protein